MRWIRVHSDLGRCMPPSSQQQDQGGFGDNNCAKSISTRLPEKPPTSRFLHPDGEKRSSRAPRFSFSSGKRPNFVRTPRAILGFPGISRGLRMEQNQPPTPTCLLFLPHVLCPERFSLPRSNHHAAAPANGVSCRGGGWNFGAPQAKFSSNPDENFTGFRREECQRVGMLLVPPFHC